MAKATQVGSSEDVVGSYHDREWAEIKVEPTKVTSMDQVEDGANEKGTLEVGDQGDELES